VADVLPTARSQDKDQARFRRLIQQIERERAGLEEWRQYLARYSQRVTLELEPLQNQNHELRRRLVFLLDAHFKRPDAVRGKHLRAKLSAWIAEHTELLLATQEEADLVALHDKHADMSHAEAKELELSLFKDMFETFFDVEMEDDDEASNLEEMTSRAMHKLLHRQGQEDRRRSQRRKSAQTQAAEARRAEAEKQASQSVREVYRKLASALHPDRSCDRYSQEQRTTLMQRVNRAYEAGDLLELLNIQLEVEQIDAQHLTTLSKERLQHYNRVLNGQLQDLKREVMSLMQPFRLLLPPIGNPKPVHVDRALDEEIARLGQENQSLANDLARFEDAKALVAALKAERLEQDLYDPDALDTVFGFDVDEDGPYFPDTPVPATPRRKRKRRR
jgi:hypothetical protein